MRNKLFVIGLAFSFVSFASKAQQQFQKYFSDLVEYQALATSTVDNSYVIAASTSSNEGLNFSAVKLNTHGEVVWNKTYSSPNDDYLTNMVITPTGDIILGGYKLNSGGYFEFSLMKINAAGALQWYKTFGTTDMDVTVYTGTNTAGDIYLVGNTETDTNKYVTVLKISTEGTIIWNKMIGSSFGVNKNIISLAATVTKDNGIAIFGNDTDKSYLLKISTGGVLNFTALHNTLSSAFEGKSSIKQTSDDGFIFCGKVKDCSLDLCTYRFALMKMDVNGDITWSKNEDQKYTGEGKKTVETADGKFVSIGLLSDDYGSKLTVIETDANGLLLWSKTYGSVDSYGEYADVDISPDGGFIFLGFEEAKALFIKTDNNGTSNCHEQILTPTFVDAPIPKKTTVSFAEINNNNNITTPIACVESQLLVQHSFICDQALAIENDKQSDQFLVYPNPFKESLVIELIDPSFLTKDIQFTLYNALGKKIINQQVSVDNNRLVISRAGIPKGIYFYEIRNNEHLIIAQGKVIGE